MIFLFKQVIFRCEMIVFGGASNSESLQIPKKKTSSSSSSSSSSKVTLLSNKPHIRLSGWDLAAAFIQDLNVWDSLTLMCPGFLKWNLKSSRKAKPSLNSVTHSGSSWGGRAGKGSTPNKLTLWSPSGQLTSRRLRYAGCYEGWLQMLQLLLS